MAPTRFQPKTMQRQCRKLAGLLTLVFLLVNACHGSGEETFSEYKVKALFLYNFAKYVDWPVKAFPDATAPIVIGIVGKDRFEGELEEAVKGKTVKGRTFAIKHLAADGDLSGCQIVFISNSTSTETEEILRRIGTLPILTVGEDKTFEAAGGDIVFVLKEGRVRLTINLAAATKAGLRISSKLLAVADEVKR